VESPLSPAWLLKSQISKLAKVFLQRQSVVACKLIRVATTARNRVENVMRRTMSVIVEEAIATIDEMMTAERMTTRTGRKPLPRCPPFLLLECTIPFHSRSQMECPSCLLASVSPAKQQHNRHNLLHPDIATESSRFESINLCKSLLDQLSGGCLTEIPLSFRHPQHSNGVLELNHSWDAYSWTEILVDMRECITNHDLSHRSRS
jgi:hypothetical protein